MAVQSRRDWNAESADLLGRVGGVARYAGRAAFPTSVSLLKAGTV
jgi:hypothetical protein